MKYILLIHEPAGGEADADMLGRHMVFAENAARQGKLVGGSQLGSVLAATTIRRRGGESVITDGPHAETKEHLGGYYVVDCSDLDEAIDLARGVPISDGGSVEIRPLVEH